MNGWEIDPTRLRALREQAELRARDMAKLLDCHERHYYKFETDTVAARVSQPSPVLAHAIVRVLSQRLGRVVTFDDVAHRVPSRRKSAA